MDNKDLDHLGFQSGEPAPVPPPPPELAPPLNPAWQRVLLARHPKRPHSLDYIGRLITDFQEIHGDRFYGDDAAIVCGMGKFEDRHLMVIGQQKGRDTKQKLLRNFGMPKPEGYRKALRAMKMAAKFGRPILTLIDTPGAYPGIDAEERGQAEAIAVSLLEMARIETPIIVVVIGEGGSGGALAIGLGDRVYMLENAVYSVISPESCAAIIYRDAGKAEQAAAALKLTAPDLLGLGIIDGIVPEPPEGAQLDHDAAAGFLRTQIRHALAELEGRETAQLLSDRYEKFRRMGSFSGRQTRSMNRNVGILLAVLGFVAFFGFLYYSSLGGSYRVEVCMEFRGRQQCRAARAKTRNEAIRTASENACAEISSGMTDTMACGQGTPVSVRDIK